MEILIALLLYMGIVFFAALSGLYEAFKTLVRDEPENSWFWCIRHEPHSYSVAADGAYDEIERRAIEQNWSTVIFTDDDMIGLNGTDLWYVGGNVYYPRPGNFLKLERDAFHTWEMMENFMWSFATVFAFMLGAWISHTHNWLAYSFCCIAAWFSYAWQGYSFSFFHGYYLDATKNTKLTWPVRFLVWLVTETNTVVYTIPQTRK